MYRITEFSKLCLDSSEWLEPNNALFSVTSGAQMSWKECLNSSIKVALLGASSSGRILVCAVVVLGGVCVEVVGLGVVGVGEVDVCEFSSFWVVSSISENELVKLYMFGLVRFELFWLLFDLYYSNPGNNVTVFL